MICGALRNTQPGALTFAQRSWRTKKTGQLALGEHVRFYFEDATTIRYQIQEMLRIERVFEAEGIEEELSAYNPLIPDGHNWKATFMIEIPDPAQRAVRLGEMIGIEDQVWLQVGDMDRIVPVADEDLDRTTADKTASVHFMRFEVTPEQINALKDGATLYAGIDHPSYPIERYEVPQGDQGLTGIGSCRHRALMRLA